MAKLRVIRYAEQDGSYGALHKWINRNFPRIGRCEYCGQAKRTEYAVARQDRMTRNRADWFELCLSCHRRFDGIGEKVGARNRNRRASEATRQKMSEANKRRWAKVSAEDRRANMANAIAAPRTPRGPMSEAHRQAISSGSRAANARRREASA